MSAPNMAGSARNGKSNVLELSFSSRPAEADLGRRLHPIAAEGVHRARQRLRNQPGAGGHVDRDAVHDGMAARGLSPFRRKQGDDPARPVRAQLRELGGCLESDRAGCQARMPAHDGAWAPAPGYPQGRRRFEAQIDRGDGGQL